LINATITAKGRELEDTGLIFGNFGTLTTLHIGDGEILLTEDSTALTSPQGTVPITDIIVTGTTIQIVAVVPKETIYNIAEVAISNGLGEFYAVANHALIYNDAGTSVTLNYYILSGNTPNLTQTIGNPTTVLTKTELLEKYAQMKASYKTKLQSQLNNKYRLVNTDNPVSPYLKHKPLYSGFLADPFPDTVIFRGIGSGACGEVHQGNRMVSLDIETTGIYYVTEHTTEYREDGRAYTQSHWEGWTPHKHDMRMHKGYSMALYKYDFN